MRSIALVTHMGKPEALQHASELAQHLERVGFRVYVIEGQVPDAEIRSTVLASAQDALSEAELLISIGGDGTFLRAARLSAPTGTPILAINLGRVGFLTEVEPSHLSDLAHRIEVRSYRIEERMSIDAEVWDGAEKLADEWGLNEISVERAARRRVLDLRVSVDGDIVSSWGCDGVLVSTPTGSTAYAFSAGGPVIWPSVQALLLVPISAHALFQRPMVIGPDSEITLEVAEHSAALVTADGRREHAVREHGRVYITSSPNPVRVVRLDATTFASRLVQKFRVDTNGWRSSP